MVVVVMVLSRARQCSEERDFGNGWPDGRAQSSAALSNHQSGKSELPLGQAGTGLGLAVLVASGDPGGGGGDTKW